jgi:hypothetical protein
MVTIGMMTICTATAIKAQKILLPMSLTNNQCTQLLHMHWLEHHHHHQQQQKSHQNKYVIILVTRNAPKFLRNPQPLLAVVNKKWVY